jgi:hypothetical protein
LTAIDHSPNLRCVTSGATRAEVGGATDLEKIQVDDGDWPLLVIRWPSGERSDAEVVDLFARLAPLGEREEPHVTLVDAELAAPPTPAQLGLLIAALKECPWRTHCVATALVARSARVRALADSLRWMHLTPTRYGHFVEIEPARVWLEQQLGRARHASGTHAVARRRGSTAPPQL